MISWVIEWLKRVMSHRRTFRTCTHWAWAIWDMSKYDLFWIIHDPGCQKRITLSLESIIKIPFEAGTGYVKIPEWRQHGTNRRMPCLVSILGTFWGTWNQPNDSAGAICRCMTDILSNIATCEIQRPGMVIAQRIGQVSLVGCTNEWHDCHSGRKLILLVPPPISCVRLAEYSAIFPVCEVHRFKIEVCLQWEMCQKELYTFENISVV